MGNKFSFPLKRLIYPGMYIYILFSIFETYINMTIGHIARYYMLLYAAIVFVTCLEEGRFREVTRMKFMWVVWFLYSLATVVWSTDYTQVATYIFTYVTMGVVLLCADFFDFNRQQIDRLMLFYQICSFILCVLGYFFSGAYSAGNEMRYVLRIGNAYTDPNYLLTLYIICVQIGFYFLINKGRGLILNIASVIVGTYVIFMTGSRSGVVMLVVSLLLLSINKLARVNFIRKVVYIVVASVAILFLLDTLAKYIPTDTLSRIMGQGIYAYTNGTGRAEWIAADYAEWKGVFNVVMGMGFGSNTTHSTILSFLFEFGIFGTTLFVIPMIALAVYLVKKHNVLALTLMLCGLFQAFICPATNMRFFWNSLIIPIMIKDVDFSVKGKEVFEEEIESQGYAQGEYR